MNEDKIVVVKTDDNGSSMGYLKLDADILTNSPVVKFHDNNLPVLTATAISNGLVTATGGGNTYYEYTFNVRITKAEVDRIMTILVEVFPRADKDFYFNGADTSFVV